MLNDAKKPTDVDDTSVDEVQESVPLDHKRRTVLGGVQIDQNNRTVLGGWQILPYRRGELLPG